MKIVILDGYTTNPGDLSWEGFETIGELVVYDRTPNEFVAERIGDAEVVYTNKAKITSEVIDKCNRLEFVGVLATGYDVIDLSATKEKNILVANIPQYGTDAVAQFAIALLLEVCHRIGAHSESVKKGEWTNNSDWCYWKYPLMELTEKTMGIIGLGKIGQRTALIAQALNMNVLCYDIYRVPSVETDKCKYTDLDNLFGKSDVIALHCPLLPETKGIINKNNIEKMKDGVIIINNSRGQLIVEQDLADSLESGKVGAAGLDVVSTEPIKRSNPLLDAPNCIITPHISWASKESRQRLIDVAVNNLLSYIDGRPINIVN